MESYKKRVVVIGGGFAGSWVAKYLERDFDVTLIDGKDYFEFTPGVLRSVVKPDHLREIQILHTHYLKRARVVRGCVREISDRYVVVGKKKLEFDYLVICSGSSYNVPFKESDIVIATRARHLRDNYRKLCAAKRVLIIGGGLVGVELCAEICWRYGRTKEITIVHARDRLIERNHLSAIRYAERYLHKKGVHILFDESVIDGKGRTYWTDKGRRIQADIAFLCTGITPNFVFMKKYFSHLLNERHYIKVNDYLQLLKSENIFAAGDVTDRVEEKTAQNALRQARTVAHNIYALESGNSLIRYQPKQTPLVISLGPYNGIFAHRYFTLTGFIPGLMKSVIERWQMWKKRL